MSVDLSIIIVNWNTCDLLAKCLESLARDQLAVSGERLPNAEYRIPITETIVVDNASTDASAAMVRERFPWVRLIESPDNLGFAAGNNLALQQATGQQVLLFNPDTEVTKGALARLWQVLASCPEAGIAGAQLLNADGSLQRSAGVFPSAWTEMPLINRRLRPVRETFEVNMAEGSATVQSVDWVSGASLMIKRQVMEAIGLLDESFWLYTEEADWCYRARAAGWDVLLVPDARVFHLERAASSQRFVFTMLHFYQSKVRFVRKHHGPAQASLMRNVLRAKAAVWRRRPSGSPLRGAYRDLSDEQVMSAYDRLADALALPLSDYLASDWKS